jgi:glycosyltransferase involved in cell wall biosynthesis
MSRRRVLVIAYVFPPAGGAGVQRVTKFVKYLPEFGWDCSVLTVANPSVPVLDPSLCDEIPSETLIRLARTLEPGYALKSAFSAGSGTTNANARAARPAGRTASWKRWIKSAVRAAGNAVLQPDAQILWRPDAVRQGLRLLKEVPHDAIFVTAPPFSSLLTAAELSRRSGLPLVLDYRDEWGISNSYQENRQKSRFSHWLQQRMQRSVLKQADAVVATTRRSAQSLRELTREAGGTARIRHLYNGFDAADLAGLPVTEPEVEPGEPVLRLTYVGTLWNLTSIEPVVAAMERVAQTAPHLASRLELVIAGRRTAEQDLILDRLNGLPCRLRREGYVAHQTALQLMGTADELLLLLSDLPGAERVMPAKTFEYLALNRPLLAVTPPGEVSELLADCPQASVFSPADVDGLTQHLRRRLEELKPQRGHAESSDFDAVRFERRTLTQQLAEVLDEVCQHRAGSPMNPSHVQEPLLAGVSS